MVCVSPRSHKPISLTTMVLNYGDSSACKDITSDKIMGPMTVARLAKLVREAELAEAKKNQDNDQRKAEEQRISKNRTDILYQGLSFSAESLVFEVSNRAANGGFHPPTKVPTSLPVSGVRSKPELQWTWSAA